MNFARYPRYKASGVEWLGEVPAHWDVLQLRHLARMKSGETITSDSIRDAGEYPVYGGNGLRGYSNSFTHDGSYILIGRQGALCGNVNYATARFWASEHAVVVQPLRPLVTRWLGEMLRAMNLNRYSVSAAQPGLAVEMIAALRTAVPPMSEQRAIAAFLDRETARIDALVAEQERLIELLREKRQAVISHAVTKGLDPHAPMKDSGIEWMGDVPAHWTVKPIKCVARLESGHTPSRYRPEYWENCTVPWFSLSDIWQVREAGRSVVVETNERVSELGIANSAARKLPAGTVMLSRTASVGFSAIMGVEMATTQDFANWVCGPCLLPEFLLHVFRSMKSEFSRLMMGSTHNTIYMPDIQAMRCAVPPVKEQGTIVAFISDQTERVDARLADATEAVCLLSERRSALISAAVTGQIDVRNAVPVEGP